MPGTASNFIKATLYATVLHRSNLGGGQWAVGHVQLFLYTQYIAGTNILNLTWKYSIISKPPCWQSKVANIKFIDFTVHKHLIKINTAKVRRRLWNNQSISHFLGNGVLKNSLHFYIALRIYTKGGFTIFYFFGISIGITQRMIDISKEITFYGLKNVWKCTVFSHLQFKVCKKCYYDPKLFFREKFHYGYQQTLNFMLISNLLIPAFKNGPKKS